jgi:hypothetical protein
MILRPAHSFQTAEVRDIGLRRNTDTRADEAQDRWAADAPFRHLLQVIAGLQSRRPASQTNSHQ